LRKNEQRVPERIPVKPRLEFQEFFQPAGSKHIFYAFQ
jgi:hypothetical protein